MTPSSNPPSRRGTAGVTRPIASMLALGALHEEVIEQSHERCASFGLSPIESPDFAPLPRADLNETRERNIRLFTHAAPVMEMLFDQIAGTQSMLVLTDACGTIIHSIGDDDFLAKASKVALRPGISWAESARGTNAIGTALISESPTVVHADEHFMIANQFLSCQASPIFDARGNILGVLDVTGDHRRFHQHTMGLVKMSARMIENHWLSDSFRNVLRVHLHSRVEFLGTLMEGILAVGGDGRIVGANRSALDHLGLSSAAVRMHSLSSLLGTSLENLVDHFRAPLAVPLALHLPHGAVCHVHARFNWATWYGLGDPVADRGRGLAEIGRPAPTAASLSSTAAASPRRSLPTPWTLRKLDTGDAQTSTVITKLRKVLDRDIAVLIVGETGTGKELLARAIHHESKRAQQPFVAVNFASIPESLIESELFGREDGSFSGARHPATVGKIVQADGGTLFLDEIGDMPLALQARLLRVLQERQVTPLGSSKPIPVDLAVISATRHKLRDRVDTGAFREDLYCQLNGLVVKLPALRERSDLAVLTRAILQDACPERTPSLSAEALRHVQAYRWPGNLRQLANVLRTAVVMADGAASITMQHLSDDFVEEAKRDMAQAPASMTAGSTVAAEATAPAALPTSRITLESIEIETIRFAVEAARGNISEAAKRLGISRNTIYRKLRWNAPAA